MRKLGSIPLIFLLLLFFCLNGPVFASETDYKVGPGDVLRISVYDHGDLSTVARVDNDGVIIFPLAGKINVGGVTTAEASETIASKLAGDYVINPQVSVFVDEFRSKTVVVIGEVARPGLYELSGPTTLLELISKAGGLTREAGRSATIRRAKIAEEDKDEVLTVSVEDLLDAGMNKVDVPLSDGDTVNIPKAGVVYVTGQVNRPSAYSLDGKTTVIKAITMAGGFTALASQGKVKIIRKIDGREEVMERVSLHEQLISDDVMVVPESFF